MIKGSLQDEDFTCLNIYAPNTGAHKYTEQIITDTKGEIYRNIIIIGEFNTPLIMDRSLKQKIRQQRI